MKILVTGATGFIGKHLLILLRERGHHVRVLTRDPEKAVVRLPVACEVFPWDTSLLEAPADVFQDIDAVVHLAGESIMGRWTRSRKEEIRRSRVLSTHHLVQAMCRLPVKPGAFVCASGIGYYGDRGAVELDESAPRGQGFLAGLCEQWEQEAMRAADAGIRTALLRIGMVLGPEGGALKAMLPAFRLGLGGRCGHGNQYVSWIHVRDLAGLIVHCLETESLQGPVNAVAPNPATNGEFTRNLAEVLHRPAFLHMPAGGLKLILGDLSEVLLQSQRVLPKKALDAGYEFVYPDLVPALTGICDVFTHELLMEQWVPQPIEKVFAFFSEARNLEILTPPSLRFRVTSQSTRTIQEGTRINYQLHLHGIPFRWQSVIMDWHPKTRFSDIQVRGPYWLWHHTHDFIEQDGGTLIRDRALYRLPFWTPGDLLIHPWVRKDLETIFAYRWRKNMELFGE